MTDKLIVSRSEIEALLVYPTGGCGEEKAIYEDELRALLDKAEKNQVEPVGYVITGKLGDRCSFKATNLNKGDTIYTSPPNTVPVEKYNKLLEALKAVNFHSKDNNINAREISEQVIVEAES